MGCGGWTLAGEDRAWGVQRGPTRAGPAPRKPVSDPRGEDSGAEGGFRGEGHMATGESAAPESTTCLLRPASLPVSTGRGSGGKGSRVKKEGAGRIFQFITVRSPNIPNAWGSVRRERPQTPWSRSEHLLRWLCLAVPPSVRRESSILSSVTRASGLRDPHPCPDAEPDPRSTGSLTAPARPLLPPPQATTSQRFHSTPDEFCLFWGLV